MAEYIERENVIFHCSYHGDCVGSGSECEGCSDNVIDYQDFMQIPTADVIERSKIDKAIEEIEKIDLIVHDGINHYYKDGEEVIAEVLEILKRNIGE